MSNENMVTFKSQNNVTISHINRNIEFTQNILNIPVILETCIWNHVIF